MHDNENDEIVQKQQLDKNTRIFYGLQEGQKGSPSKKNQSEEDALRVFYGYEEAQDKARNLGAPIPGYCGVNRRVGADNVFGMTYADARKKAEESQKRVCDEKGETLRTTAPYVPEYARPKEDQDYY